MALFDQFRSAIYCQTAPAEHWGMPKVVDGIAKDIRDQARATNIATLDASQFWTSIKAFTGPEQLPPVSGVKSEEPPVAGVESEDACETKPDENVVNWHHFETGETDQLPYHWDRYIFRLICYMETSLIHEPVKGNIFDMKKIGALSTDIRNGIKEYRRIVGNDHIGGIPESIIPTQRSYREATSPSRKKEKVKIEQGEIANAELKSGMEVESGENTDDSQIPALDDALGENADAEAVKAEQEEKRINKIMSYVTKVYRPDPSKLIMKDDRQFVLPPWAKDRNTAKCTFCEALCQVDRPLRGETKPVCSRCEGTLLIAEDIAAATSDTPWSADDLNLVTEVIGGNRETHNLDNDKAATKTEKKVPDKKKKTKSFINKVFGHNQNAIEGFRDCEGDMQKSLNLERSERDAATEFEGAVKTEKKGDARKSNDDDGKYPKERPLPDSHEADGEDEELFRRPEFKEMAPDLLETAST